MDRATKRISCRRPFLIILSVIGFLGAAALIIIAILIVGLQGNGMVVQKNEGAQLMPPQVAVNPKSPAEIPIIKDRVIILNPVDTTTLDLLNQENIPINDPIELAERLGGLTDAPVYKSELPVARKAGDSKNFWVLDVDTNDYRQITAHLEYITPHLYFWVEKGIDVDPFAVAELAEEFENKIYPTTRQIFGSEWTPGVDHDEHLTILYTTGLGGAAGYFSSTDSLTIEVEKYSNETEMFYLSADYTSPDSVYTYGVLAHEFQHMIHWNIDRNESSWISEGLSELAVELNGFGMGDFSFYFALNPDLQLNFWPGNEQGDSYPHYGASYLFMKYLMDRFGLESIRELVANKNVGLTSIDEVYGPKDQESGIGHTSEKIFQDWSIANYIAGAVSSAANTGYKNATIIPAFFPTETLTCDSEWQTRTVSQFGSDYIAINCPGAFRVELVGGEVVPLLPVEPYSGKTYFWSNYGDSSSMTLRQTFDLRNIEGDITLKYWSWFDLESDYDYLYLIASTDGKNWENLNPSRCTREDPTGSNYGCGYNGRSNGWLNESVDLTRYSGDQVTLQFKYVTDLAVNGDGFVIDDVSIEAIQYFTDFEKDNGGWEGEGFVRIENTLPQNFGYTALSSSVLEDQEKLISIGGLNINQTLNQTNQDFQTVIVINGLTRYTRIPAEYRIRITRLESN